MSWRNEGGRSTRDGKNEQVTPEDILIQSLFIGEYSATNQILLRTPREEDSAENNVYRQPNSSFNVECPYGPIGSPRPKVDKNAQPKENKDGSSRMNYNS